MKRRAGHAIILAAALAVATPALADEAARDRIKRGLQLLQEGGALLMQGLAESAEPTLEDVLRQLDDLSAYDAPVILPNGDILIRRKRTPGDRAGEEDAGDRPEAATEGDGAPHGGATGE